MTYSSAIFKNETDNLQVAQKNKYNQLLKLAEIKDSDAVLEIGSGWGGLVDQITVILIVKLQQQQFLKNNINM